jgi:hypothetical protein
MSENPNPKYKWHYAWVVWGIGLAVSIPFCVMAYLHAHRHSVLSDYSVSDTVTAENPQNVPPARP